MRNFIFAFALLLFSSHVFSQSSPQEITFKNGFFGWQFRQGEEKLKTGEVADLLQVNPEAARLFSSGRSNYTIATIISTIGGGMLGYTLGTQVGGGDPNWTVGGIGIGLTVISIPISISATSKVKRALALYNEGPKTGSIKKTDWQLGLTSNGLGLVYHF